MSKLDYPSRIYSLSDCHGGGKWHPFKSPDVAAQIAKHIRSDQPVGVRDFDIHGLPPEYVRYIIDEAHRLHDENRDSEPTGIFVNSAPRTEVGENGDEFYLAEFANGLRVVTTPLTTLSDVRGQVQSLYQLPNEDNGLYGEHEQHRSSFTERLLAKNHGLPIQKVSPDKIPEPTPSLHLAYVDRFGNLVIKVDDKAIYDIEKAKEERGETEIVIAGTRAQINLTTGLDTGRPGTLIGYRNDGHLEVLSKWKKKWDTRNSREKHSAWLKLGCPKIGAEVEINKLS